MTLRPSLVLIPWILACTVSPRASDTAASPTPDPRFTPAPSPTGVAPADDGGEDEDRIACNSDADCDGGVCEGEGCGDMAGRCMPADRMCTRDARPYCDCDGVTFRGSGTCPGKRFAHTGPCESAAAKPDGAPCTRADECGSGVCEGQGCDVAGACMSRDRQCTMDLRQYCSCDGKTFESSGSCPGARFSKRDAC